VDILSPRFDLGIWSIIIFVLLLVVLWKFAWGPMLQGLHHREQTIHQAVEEAVRARDEAQRLREQLQREMDHAHEKVRELLEDARRDADQNTAQMLAKAKADIQTERERLHREIETATDQALQQIWNQTAQLAVLVSTKAIRRQLTPDDHHRLVDEALAEVRQASGNGRRIV